VTGFADRKLRKPEAPHDVMNRRVSIVVKYRQEEVPAAGAPPPAAEPPPPAPEGPPAPQGEEAPAPPDLKELPRPLPF
jgi:hypothetical protein